MLRTEPKLWSRGLALTFIWALSSMAGDRSAYASGCHASERPVLGLTSVWTEKADRLTEISLEAADRTSPKVVPAPCREDFPGVSVRVLPGHIASVVPSLFFKPNNSASSTLYETAIWFPHVVADGLDRPPR